MRDGLWKLVHLASCCGKLGWDDLELLHLSPGDMADEASMKELVPPLEGEFWDREQLEMLTLALKVHLCFRHELGNDDWTLPLPPKPLAPAANRGIEQRPCRRRQFCYACGSSFSLWMHLASLMSESCPYRESNKVDCGTCGVRVIKRNLKRHVRSFHEVGDVESR